MSRILVVGPCPSWAMPDGMAASAKNLRVWQLVQPLLADGHDVLLCITDIGDSEPVIKRHIAGVHYQVIEPSGLRWRRRIRAACRDFAPDALIAVMWHNGVLSLCLPKDIPLWVDLFGYPMGEAQVIFRRQNCRRLPLSAIAFHKRLLQRCDVLSTGGQRHAFATIGELGMAARLNSHTLGYPLVHAIQPGIASAPLAPECTRQDALHKSGLDIQTKLLWIGGYNAWTDVDTLYEGVSLALQADPSLVFVSTGGAIKSVDSSSYPHLLERIAASPFRERFQMLGWVPAEELEQQLTMADIGVVVDTEHYETLLGTRTRLVEMMSKGIPVVTSLGCELSYIIRDHGAGATCRQGDPKALALAILSLSRDPSRRREYSENALRLMESELNAPGATHALCDWARTPTMAPDRLKKTRVSLMGRIDMGTRKWARLALWDCLGHF